MLTASFDATTHTYTVNGQVWPSVTSVCGAWKTAVTGREPFYPSDLPRDIGTNVHSAIALDLLGNLEWSSLDPALLGYMQAYGKVKKKLRLKPGPTIKVETLLVGEGYCGTADLITDSILLDWKTGRYDWTHWMQLAAYRKCEPCHGLRRAGCAYLAKDGSFEIRWMSKADYKSSWRWFWAALDLLDCRKAHTRQKVS